jgi:uncharacterized membrane protein
VDRDQHERRLELRVQVSGHVIELDNFVISLAGWIELIANFISILLIAAGVVVASYKVLQTIRQPDMLHYNKARLAFSRYLVVALEFQLAADIVKTAAEPTWTDLGILAVVAVIRTFLNFFLQREMKEEQQEVEHASGTAGR